MRRVIILVIFLAVFFLFGYGTRQLTQTNPTCTDGIKNGNEEGVD
jgi:predicted RND superfamily exporter protein